MVMHSKAIKRFYFSALLFLFSYTEMTRVRLIWHYYSCSTSYGHLYSSSLVERINETSSVMLHRSLGN